MRGCATVMGASYDMIVIKICTYFNIIILVEAVKTQFDE